MAFQTNDVVIIGNLTSDLVPTGKLSGYRTSIFSFGQKIPLYIPSEVIERLKMCPGEGTYVKLLGSVVRAKHGHCLYVKEIRGASFKETSRNFATIEGKVSRETTIKEEIVKNINRIKAHMQIVNYPEISNSVTINISANCDKIPLAREIYIGDEIVTEGSVVPRQVNDRTYLFVSANSIKK